MGLKVDILGMNKISRWFGNLDKILFLWVAIFAINIITFFLVYYKVKGTDKPLALHYSILTGVDLYGKASKLYTLPILAFFLSSVNVGIFGSLKKGQFFLSLLAAIVSLIIQIILLLAVFFILRIN